jgi:predicted regulator of Ras-like GTPase activity (Roadblock/LC7/MglB family)
MPSNADPLTQDEHEDLDDLLNRYVQTPGVRGVLIVNHGGLLLDSTLNVNADPEDMAVWALAVYMNTQNATRKLGPHRLRWIISKTDKEYISITDWSGGILVLLADIDAAAPFRLFAHAL